MTIWLYARVSQDETSIHCCGKPHRLAFGKTTTCDRCGREIANNEVPDRVKSQFADMRRLVEYRQIQGDIVELWEVTSAASAPLRKREHGRMLLTHTKRGDHVVAVHLFRLFRGMKDTVISMEELAKRGVNVHCVQHDIDTTSAMGRAFVQFLGIMGELETAMQSERRRERARQLKAEGRAAGETPFGTRPDKRRDETGRIIPVLVPNEKEAKLLHQLRMWHNDRKSAPWMHAMLAKLDWKSRRGGHYSLTQVRRLLKMALETRQPGLIATVAK